MLTQYFEHQIKFKADSDYKQYCHKGFVKDVDEGILKIVDKNKCKFEIISGITLNIVISIDGTGLTNRSAGYWNIDDKALLEHFDFIPLNNQNINSKTKFNRFALLD